jgi:taurine dioxygenase
MAAVLDRQDLSVQPSGTALGADIEGVNLTGSLSPELMASITQAWSDHLVLRFRGQALSDDHLLRFSRQFGGDCQEFRARRGGFN